MLPGRDRARHMHVSVRARTVSTTSLTVLFIVTLLARGIVDENNISRFP